MSTLLRIDASARDTGSISRALGDHFTAAWQKRHHHQPVIHRDLAVQQAKQLSAKTISGFYTPREQFNAELTEATALSDELIGELHRADVLLITTPMYNFSIPAALKAWVDQIVRIGITFAYDGKKFSGLVTCQRAYVLVAYGVNGFLNNGPLGSFDFVKPYLQWLLNFIGIQDVRFIGVEGTSVDVANLETRLHQAKQQIEQTLMHD